MSEATSRDANTGSIKATGRVKWPLPKRGQVKRYILSCAQNNTALHEACWTNMQALAEHYGAEIKIATFTYRVSGMSAKGQKKTAKENMDDTEWWDERVLQHLSDERAEIAPGLVWCGDLQILPTAARPLSGLESLTGRDSSVVPHVQACVSSVPSPKGAGCKLLYTTGTATVRRYLQKKAGQKAEFHHAYGGLLVEVRHDGTWFVRQLNADSDGTIYDLTLRAKDGRVTDGHRAEAVVWGDIHTRQLEPAMRNLVWGQGGILDSLRPKRQVMHDVLDFKSQNHHDRGDPWKTYAKFGMGSDVEFEVDELACFLDCSWRPWCETVIAAANHDEAMDRWLREADWRYDPQNADLHLAGNLAALKAAREGKPFQAVKWAMRYLKALPCRVKWLARDEEYIVCPDANGGIELGMHGDLGANGSRGTLAQFARMGRKCVVGHTHTAAMQEGATCVGVMGSLDMGYNRGPSSWSHSFCIVQPNGKRQLVTIWKGKAWA